MRNPDLQLGLSSDGLVWAFTTNHFSNWHPLTWLSFLFDYELHGLDPAGYHATNLALHAANTLLLFAVLRASTRRELPSAFAAALFAVHPLHVESVAWVSERKDLLSTFFGLSALWAYVGYVRRPRVARYACMLALFAAGLLAKQMLVTLPFLFLLLDYWPLRRLAPACPPEAAGLGPTLRAWAPPRRLLVEKLPMLALSAAASIAIFQIQQYEDPALGERAIPLHLRVANAAVSYVRYLAKLFWPADLSALYPHPYLPEWGGVPWSPAAIAGAFAVLAALSALVFYSRRGYAVVGWLWFLGTLVPVIGLVQVGIQAMADRYSYFPLIGCFVALAFGADELWGRLRRAGSLRLAVPALAVASIAACLGVAAAQARVWRDSIALFSHAVELDPRNVRFRYNLARELQMRGQIDGAIAHYREVLRVNPNHGSTYNNLGTALLGRGEVDEAIRQLRRAVALDPDYADAHFNLGNALAASGELRSAIRSYRRAVRADPAHAAAHVNLGNALISRGHIDAAIGHYRSALRADPQRASAHLGLARALRQKGEPDAAIRHLRAALEIDPEDLRARQILDVIRAEQAGALAE